MFMSISWHSFQKGIDKLSIGRARLKHCFRGLKKDSSVKLAVARNGLVFCFCNRRPTCHFFQAQGKSILRKDIDLVNGSTFDVCTYRNRRCGLLQKNCPRGLFVHVLVNNERRQVGHAKVEDSCLVCLILVFVGHASVHLLGYKCPGSRFALLEDKCKEAFGQFLGDFYLCHKTTCSCKGSPLGKQRRNAFVLALSWTFLDSGCKHIRIKLFVIQRSNERSMRSTIRRRIAQRGKKVRPRFGLGVRNNVNHSCSYICRLAHHDSLRGSGKTVASSKDCSFLKDFKALFEGCSLKK